MFWSTPGSRLHAEDEREPGIILLMRRLQEDALIVFVSDSHIGGDPGCDGFESPKELRSLLEELAEIDGPVELILAGDFFDFLQISPPRDGADRAALTISRPEYKELFAALGRFKRGERKQVVYLPGNHDTEMWWNPKIQQTLRERGLVDEFTFSYEACFEVGGERKVVYCEHGNQFDPANIVEDYKDPLDTPLGHHVVTDFTRRVAPFGEISRGLDLSEIKNVYPLVEIPRWIASRYFYNAVGMVAGYLLLPLLVMYAVYRMIAYLIAVTDGYPVRFFQSYQELPRLHTLFLDLVIVGALTILIFAVFFLIVRYAVRRALGAVSLKQRPGYSPAISSQEKIRAVLRGEAPSPMNDTGRTAEIDVFVSGHTHLPSLVEVEKRDGRRGIMVNSGCWLRQLQPVSPHLKGPPVFVSRFVLTHVRVYVEGPSLRVELWDYPKPAEQRLTRTERLLSLYRRPPQPPLGSKPRVRASSTL
ncbi:MAG: metallophosphoesterase [Actinobacteria bacterium]|nr:metallophosphoesterase [Actinomycetota bacterium]MCA1737618.1 metallophosphoesterase [Actinomycetota bacterium]